MKRNSLYSLLALVVCVIVSLLIQQYSSQFYPDSIAKIQTVVINEQEQQVQAIVMNGSQKGQMITLFSPYQENEVENVHLASGEQVFYRGNEVIEKKRDGYVFFIFSLLLVTLVAVGGKAGILTFISGLLNCLSLFWMIHIYRKNPQIPLLALTIIYMTLAVALTLFLIDGLKRNSLKKFFSTIITILLAFGVCYFTMAFFQDKGLRFEDMGVLTRPYRPIFLASLLVGTIGAVLDTVVTVIATLEEIESQNTKVTAAQLLASGKVVGSDISGTMINVLICSYFSSAIPMLLLYLFNGWSFPHAINMLLSLEAVRVLCGGFGILFSIPICLVFFYFGRRRTV